MFFTSNSDFCTTCKVQFYFYELLFLELNLFFFNQELRKGFLSIVANKICKCDLFFTIWYWKVGVWKIFGNIYISAFVKSKSKCISRKSGLNCFALEHSTSNIKHLKSPKTWHKTQFSSDNPTLRDKHWQQYLNGKFFTFSNGIFYRFNFCN